jgi:hypothetical protein
MEERVTRSAESFIINLFGVNVLFNGKIEIFDALDSSATPQNDV